jgi:hypothetical protein
MDLRTVGVNLLVREGFDWWTQRFLAGERLYAQPELTDDDRARLAKIKVELDQCWDLLRQRRALREFGRDPDQAKVRPPDIVENYEQ